MRWGLTIKISVLFIALIQMPCARAFADNAQAYYNRIFADGRLDITVALGFEQKTPLILSFERDEIDTENDVFAFEEKLLACQWCGFRRVESYPGYRVYQTMLLTHLNRPVRVTVRFLYSGQGVSVPWLKQAFIHALGNDDAIMYNGHSRYGSGFPDFAAPTGFTGQVFRNDPVSGWMGFEKGYFARNKYQILVLNSCKTAQYYEKPLRMRVWEKPPSDLGLILTRADSYFEDFPTVSAALIEGLMQQLSAQKLVDSMNTAAAVYRASSGGAAATPLFESDGLFNNRYSRSNEPLRRIPRAPWSPMPF